MQTGGATRARVAVLVALAVGLSVEVARAGQSFESCDYVGDRENLPGFGAGALDQPRSTRSRFAGSARRISEGAPPGTGGLDFPGIPVPRTGFVLTPQCSCTTSGTEDPYSSGAQLREQFTSEGAIRVQGSEGRSKNGKAVVQNVPTCVDPTGAGATQLGFPALYRWTLGIGELVASDIHLEVCLDVRKCQEDADEFGAGMTTPIIDFIDSFGPEGPPTLRVVQHFGELRAGFDPGPSRCACEDRTLGVIPQPFGQQLVSGPPPWQPLSDSTGELEIAHAVGFLGYGCTTLIVKNAAQIAIHDFLTIEVRIPASTRVRIRASADSVQACYLGSFPSGPVD